ncbi:hypothetical protein NKT34_13680 [Paenibacillus polysaccharolyticus]|uniref:hypothetical protein n=1 Tax=Paenibacillus polysaccharolyticus TaxID=582692 RepID=UPI0020A163B4|nr:hypothetical protein [Paenibacillus polysaccharolyticus]MCP1134350.1 hypothetical protein [Paenibacillus polysaccharolyticus]
MEKQDRIEQLRYELNVEKQRGAMADAGKIADIEAEIAYLEQQKVEEAQQEVAYIMDNLDLEGVTMREMFKNESSESAEAAYQVVRIAVQNALLQRDEHWMTEVKDLRERLAAETASKDASQSAADEAGEANAKLVTEIRDVRLELEDTASKRDAAVNQLEEAKAEITRLNSHIDDLRQQLAVGAAASVKVIDTGDAMAAWKEQKKREEESKPAIYDVEWVDNKKSMKRAKLAATDEVITFGYLEAGKYREVSAEEAPQFRIRAEEPERVDADMAQPESVEANDQLTPPPWGYPEEVAEESAGHELAQEQLAGSVAEERTGEVTRAEFEELKKRVAELEQPQAEVA